MTEAEIKHLKQWLEKAEHDLIAAKVNYGQSAHNSRRCLFSIVNKPSENT